MSATECLNCKMIGNCSDTSAEKATLKYFCPKWEPAEEAVVQARNQMLLDFREQGLQSILTTKNKEK